MKKTKKENQTPPIAEATIPRSRKCRPPYGKAHTVCLALAFLLILSSLIYAKLQKKKDFSMMPRPENLLKK